MRRASRPWHARPRPTLRAGVGAGLVAAGTYAAAARLPETRRQPWARTNHAGATVTLLEGPAHVAGLTFGALLTGPSGKVSALTALGAGALGALDDLVGDAASKGLKGHLKAAARGQVTTGLVKILGLAAVGLGATAALDRTTGAPRERSLAGPRGRALGRAFDVLLGGGVVAGTANLLNLFDLRPGRALKVAVLVCAPVAAARGPGAPLAAAVVGAALGAIGPDLRGESMLGDTGANALGAVIGTGWVAGASRSRRIGLLVAITTMTLASEKVSFTKVIEATPGLRELDAWGRTSPVRPR